MARMTWHGDFKGADVAELDFILADRTEVVILDPEQRSRAP